MTDIFHKPDGSLVWQVKRYLQRYIDSPHVPESERITSADVDSEVIEILPEFNPLLFTKIKKSSIITKQSYQTLKQLFGQKAWNEISPVQKLGIFLREISFDSIQASQKHAEQLAAQALKQLDETEKKVKTELDAERRQKWGIKTEQEITNEFLKDRLKEVNEK